MAAAEECAAYFEKHSVQELFDGLVKDLSKDKPEDPKAWLAARFGAAAPSAVTPDTVLAHVNSTGVNSTLEYAAQNGMEHEELLRVVRSLASEEYLNFDKSKEQTCLLYTSPSPRDRTRSRMPSSA
eukprot:TRINITY_DN15916_c0_g2_i1.p2 TRINITY_DN15916_c0_g2~~TRINITY_DN15916_c0_g2_i1.p2  ORF type:complete len:126 (-),score=45.36 TRINITY_DN15916_c0_g2_i1:29-406(-)